MIIVTTRCWCCLLPLFLVFFFGVLLSSADGPGSFGGRGFFFDLAMACGGLLGVRFTMVPIVGVDAVLRFKSQAENQRSSLSPNLTSYSIGISPSGSLGPSL